MLLDGFAVAPIFMIYDDDLGYNFPLYRQTQQVVPRLVIRTSLLFNGGTSAQLPVVN